MQKRFFVLWSAAAVILTGCASTPPGIDLYVTSFPESANIVCKVDTGWVAVGRTPAVIPFGFNRQEIAQGYTDTPCYVQWVSGKKVALEASRFPAYADRRLQYSFHVNRPEGGDLKMDVEYDARIKQANATVNAAHQQADATVRAARIMSAPRQQTTSCTTDMFGNTTCHSY